MVILPIVSKVVVDNATLPADFPDLPTSSVYNRVNLAVFAASKPEEKVTILEGVEVFSPLNPVPGQLLVFVTPEERRALHLILCHDNNVLSLTPAESSAPRGTLTEAVKHALLSSKGTTEK